MQAVIEAIGPAVERARRAGMAADGNAGGRGWQTGSR